MTEIPERGMICFYCGEGFGYVGKEPDAETIQKAVNHEAVCVQNPYIKKIAELNRDIDTLKVRGTGAYWHEKYEAAEKHGRDVSIILDILVVPVAMAIAGKPPGTELIPLTISRELARMILATRGIDSEAIRVKTETQEVARDDQRPNPDGESIDAGDEPLEI